MAKLSQFWWSTLRRLMSEQLANPERGPTLILSQRKKSAWKPPYAPPPPIIEFFTTRYYWLNPGAAFHYTWKGVGYRSFYHAFIGAIAACPRDAYDLIEYSTYHELRRVRKQGLILARPFNFDEFHDIAVSILLQRYRLPLWAGRLIYDTGDSYIRFFSKYAEDKILGIHFGDGFNVYGNALVSVREIVKAQYPDIYLQQQRDLAKVVHSNKQCAFLDYYLHNEPAETFSRSLSRHHKNISAKSSKRRYKVTA